VLAHVNVLENMIIILSSRSSRDAFKAS